MNNKLIVAGVAALLVSTQAIAAEEHGSWTGWLKQKDATNLTFVDEEQQTHEVVGAKEAELLKNFKNYENKKVKVTGILKTEGVEVDTVTAEAH